MAVAGSIDQAEYDRWAKVTCPKVVRSQAWMHGDVRQPLKVMRPGKLADLKVPRADRGTYERCSAAMLAGRLFSFSIPAQSSVWLVKVTEAEEWRELMRHEVEALLEELGCGEAVPAAKPAKAPRARKAAPAAAVVEPRNPMAVGPMDLPAPVVEYLERLVFAPKREYAAQLAAAMLAGDAGPEDPGTEWAAKVRTKLARLVVVAA